jgi:hypothetical protein
MKPKINEESAAAMVLDAIFKDLDKSWNGMWDVISKMSAKNRLPLTSKDFVKVNVGIASIAVNFRVAFDMFPQDQAERMLDIVFKLLEKFLGAAKNSEVVQHLILKYFEAWNNGMLDLRNPITDVAMLLYYKVGFENTERKLVDESYFTPEPRVVEYFANVLALFSGKWTLVKQKRDVVPKTPAKTGRAPKDPKVDVGAE